MRKEKREEKGQEKAVFKHLSSPIKVGVVELKNRMVFAPMTELMSGYDGQMTDQMLGYTAARAKGGAAWVSTGVILATKLSSQFAWGRNLHCFHPGHLHGLCMLTDHIHYFGSLALAHISIGLGRQGLSYDPRIPSPSSTAGLPYETSLERVPAGTGQGLAADERARTFLWGRMTRELSIDEIRSEQKEFASSCQLTVVAGFDAIEIHAPHGYLVHQFLSPLINKRTDMYGGEWRNRKRFVNEIMEQVRYACLGVAVGVRISAEEHVAGGLTREEMIDLAKDLEARGADFISLSDGGGNEEADHLIPNAARAEHIPDAGADFKKALKIPVIVASQHNPVKADADIGAGKFDISALGRQLFCDPEYPNKVAEGRASEIIRCKRDNICTARVMLRIPAACILNPNLGREYAMDEYKIGPRKKDEPFIPRGMMNAPMPALDRPWWMKEVPLLKKHWRAFRGPGPSYEKQRDGVS